MQTPNYVKALVRPNGQKSADRRVWNIELQGVWLPFFTSTNVTGETAIPKEALGAPLRLAKAKDGSVKFNSKGKPVMQVNKVLGGQIRLAKENFVADLAAYATTVMTERTDDYKAEVLACQIAGKPIVQKDNQEAMDAILAKAQAEAEVESKPPEQPQLEEVAA